MENKVKVSLCLTVFNEERSVISLLSSIANLNIIPTDIVVVDGGSADKTVDLIRNFQEKSNAIKLLVKKCSRAEGRNIGVRKAKNDIIAMTDAGCIAKKDWLKRLTEPFEDREVEVVAGFYQMKSSNALQKAMSVFLGVLPNDFDDNFLPSTRSLAFRKSVWERVRGFPEDIEDTAEETVYNYKLLTEGVKIERVKSAQVEWGMPSSVGEFVKKIYLYAKGDVKSGIFLFPGKGLTSHNIKALLILARYSLGFFMVILLVIYPSLLALLMFMVFLYTFWSFVKVLRKTGNIYSGLWGVLLQYLSDLAVTAGFINGLKLTNEHK
jgi:glycosyltransferase involved in cell wall biosynthesis